MLHLGGIPESSALVSSQAYRVVEVHLTAAAAGTEHAVVSQQREAAGKVYAITGNGSVDLSLARAQELAKGEVSLSAEQAACASALVTAFTDIAASSVAVIVGGLRGLGEVVACEIEWIAAASQAKLAGKVVGPATVLENGAAMGGASMAFWKDAGVCAVKVGSLTATPSAADKAVLRLVIKL